MVLNNDTSVDDIHAVVYKDSAYNTTARWQRSFFCFLWTQEPKQMKKNYPSLLIFPIEINELILEFSKGSSSKTCLNVIFYDKLEPMVYYLQHKSPIKHTYQLIKHNIPTPLKMHQRLTLGTDVDISILEINNTANNQFTIDDRKKLSVLMQKDVVEIIGIEDELINEIGVLSEGLQDPQLSRLDWSSAFDLEVSYIKADIVFHYNSQEITRDQMYEILS